MKIKVFTAFSGYDSQCMALDMVKDNHPDFDYELVGWSEIDKYACQMHDVFYPQWSERNYGDISKIDWENVPDFDLFTFSFPCFPEGTLVLTDAGYKPIEQVYLGERVLTHTNQWQMVSKLMRKRYAKDVIELNAMMCDGIVATGNHPFYVRERKRVGHRNERVFTQPQWVEARDLTINHFIGYAINQESELPKWNGVGDHRWGHDNVSNKLQELFGNKSFWYLMGRYVGDGWRVECKTGNRIVIAHSKRNTESLLNAIEQCGLHGVNCMGRTCRKVHLCSNELFEFVKRYGYKAHGKHIDIETMCLPKNLLASFIDGVIDSDGCKLGDYRKVASVSRELVYGIAQCVAKVYGRPCSIYKTKRPKKTIIEGRIVNQRDTYQVTWKTKPCKQDKAFCEDGYIWFPINSITKRNKTCVVYNLEVESDNSYTANGCIVHNCQSISNAGLQHGFAEGSGTRSSLLWECKKAIDIKRPKMLLMENVKALVQKKFMPDFQKWLDYLESKGYTNYWQVTNAKDYGIPQNRERVFCVSFLDDSRNYVFPSPRKLDKVLRDMLDPEDTIPLSYYLPQEKVDMFCKINEKKLREVMALDSPQPTSSKCQNACEGGVTEHIATRNG